MDKQAVVCSSVCLFVVFIVSHPTGEGFTLGSKDVLDKQAVDALLPNFVAVGLNFSSIKPVLVIRS